MVDIIVSIILLISVTFFAIAAVSLSINAARYDQSFDAIMEDEFRDRSHGSVK